MFSLVTYQYSCVGKDQAVSLRGISSFNSPVWTAHQSPVTDNCTETSCCPWKKHNTKGLWDENPHWFYVFNTFKSCLPISIKNICILLEKVLQWIFIDIYTLCIKGINLCNIVGCISNNKVAANLFNLSIIYAFWPLKHKTNIS